MQPEMSYERGYCRPECVKCSEVRPTGVVHSLDSSEGEKDSKKIPAINIERCIGCGACENLCPTRPFSAIYVEGHEAHRLI